MSATEPAAWARVQLARHPDRPHTLDFVKLMSPDFVELHGDRRFGDDAAIVGGPASFNGRAVMIIGQQKGRDTRENIARNFGSPHPEGYRKALRLMQQAARFQMPLIALIDTGGASPDLQSEERGMAVAIAECIMAMVELPVPTIAVVIGEGGSGGALALAIGVTDRILMLENAIYSVAGPEAAAAILWNDAKQAPIAAEQMKISAPDLQRFGIIDELLPEPEGGAHTDVEAAINTVNEAVARHLAELDAYAWHSDDGLRRLLADRYQKYRRIGA